LPPEAGNATVEDLNASILAVEVKDDFFDPTSMPLRR
jgi:hypothetical protein